MAFVLDWIRCNRFNYYTPKPKKKMKLELMQLIVMQNVRKHGTLNREYKHKIAVILCYKGLMTCSTHERKKVYALTEYGKEIIRMNEPFSHQDFNTFFYSSFKNF